MADQITLNIEGRRVKVDPSFQSLTPEQQEATVEEIASSLGVGRSGFMPQVNQGIAESVGGLADFLNPFDQPHALNPFSGGTGSAVTGIERSMDATGVRRASGDPRNAVESFARGTGRAAGALVPAGATARVMSGAGGLLGRVAGDASQTINTGRGVASELLAGGAARAAEDAAAGAGAPEWAQDVAALAGGMSTAALPYAASRTPTALGARRLGKAVRTAAMPYTERGAQEVARQRVQELAGGSDRAAELANRLANGSEIGLTPAQITDDPNMRAIEQAAARQNPALRDRLERRAAESTQTAQTAFPGAGGDVEAAQGFFDTRRQEALANLQPRGQGHSGRPEADGAQPRERQQRDRCAAAPRGGGGGRPGRSPFVGRGAARRAGANRKREAGSRRNDAHHTSGPARRYPSCDPSAS